MKKAVTQLRQLADILEGLEGQPTDVQGIVVRHTLESAKYKELKTLLKNPNRVAAAKARKKKPAS